MSLLGGATREVLDTVLRAEGRGRPVVGAHRSNGDGRSNKLRRPGSTRGASSLRASHSEAARGDNWKCSRSASTRCAASVTWETTKVVRSVFEALAARSMSARSSVVARTSIRWLRFGAAAATTCPGQARLSGRTWPLVLDVATGRVHQARPADRARARCLLPEALTADGARRSRARGLSKRAQRIRAPRARAGRRE